MSDKLTSKIDVEFLSSVEKLAFSQAATQEHPNVGLLNGRLCSRSSLKYRFLSKVLSFFNLRTKKRKRYEKLGLKLQRVISGLPTTSIATKQIRSFALKVLKSLPLKNIAVIQESHLQQEPPKAVHIHEVCPNPEKTASNLSMSEEITDDRIIDLEKLLPHLRLSAKNFGLARKIDHLIRENSNLCKWALFRKAKSGLIDNRKLGPTAISLLDNHEFGAWILKKNQFAYRYVKSYPYFTATTPHENLLRVVMADRMRSIAEEFGLDRLYIPEKYVHRINQIHPEDLESEISNPDPVTKQAYLVIVKEIKELRDLTHEILLELNISEDEQRLLAEQLCIMIEKCGLSDIHRGNIKLIVDRGVVKLALIDTEPFSAIVAKGHESNLTDLKICAGAGLKSALNRAFKNFDAFSAVIKEKLEAISR